MATLVLKDIDGNVRNVIPSQVHAISAASNLFGGVRIFLVMDDEDLIQVDISAYSFLRAVGLAWSRDQLSDLDRRRAQTTPQIDIPWNCEPN